jgi:hypothetical protein
VHPEKTSSKNLSLTPSYYLACFCEDVVGNPGDYPETGLEDINDNFLEADLWPAGNPSWPMISELPVVNRFSSQVFRHAV